MNQIQNFVQPFIQSYPSHLALGGAVICATASIEIAIKTIKAIPSLSNGEENAYENFAKNLGQAIFYAFCAANIVPYTPLIGGAIFTAHSIFTYKQQDAYIAAKILGNFVYTPFEQAVRPLGERLFKNTILPGAENISKMAKRIFFLGDSLNPRAVVLSLCSMFLVWQLALRFFGADLSSL